MRDSGDWTKAWRATALVSALPVGTLAGFLLGIGLDRVFGTGWIVTAVLGGLGFSAGVYQLFRGLQQPPDDHPRDDPP